MSEESTKSKIIDKSEETPHTSEDLISLLTDRVEDLEDTVEDLCVVISETYRQDDSEDEDEDLPEISFDWLFVQPSANKKRRRRSFRRRAPVRIRRLL